MVIDFDDYSHLLANELVVYKHVTGEHDEITGSAIVGKKRSLLDSDGTCLSLLNKLKTELIRFCIVALSPQKKVKVAGVNVAKSRTDSSVVENLVSQKNNEGNESTTSVASTAGLAAIKGLTKTYKVTAYKEPTIQDVVDESISYKRPTVEDVVDEAFEKKVKI